MKARFGFVGNSSSASFVLASKREGWSGLLEDLGEFWHADKFHHPEFHRIGQKIAKIYAGNCEELGRRSEGEIEEVKKLLSKGYVTVATGSLSTEDEEGWVLEVLGAFESETDSFYIKQDTF